MSGESSSSNLNEIMTIKNIVKVGNDYKHCTTSSNTVRARYPSVELRMSKSGDILRRPENQILNIYRDDAGELYSLNKMCAFSHRNLLSCYLYQKADDSISKMFNSSNNFAKEKNATYYVVLTEEVSGTLEYFINGSGSDKLTTKGCLPSKICLRLIWDIINAIRYIHAKQTYHGGFSRLSTPFVYQGDEIVVKLTNFIEKKGDDKEDFLEQAQLQDWFSFGTFLHDMVLAFPHTHTGHLSRVVDYFRNINVDQILAMDAGLDQFDFFMTSEDRWKYCRKLHSWCNQHASFIRNYAHFVPKPWNNFRRSYGLSVLKSVNDFKDRDGKKTYDSDYDVNDEIHFLRFVAAVYSHYNSFTNVPAFWDGELKTVDAFICYEFPNLFHHLKEMETLGGF